MPDFGHKFDYSSDTGIIIKKGGRQLTLSLKVGLQCKIRFATSDQICEYSDDVSSNIIRHFNRAIQVINQVFNFNDLVIVRYSYTMRYKRAVFHLVVLQA